MATGIIGVLSGIGALNYQPLSNAKVKAICFSNSGLVVTVNGFQLPANGEYEFFVGALQMLTVVAGNSSSTVIVSAIEENS